MNDEAFLRKRVKMELRKRMRGVRQATPSESCEARSRAITLRLESLEFLEKARSVGMFWPIESRHEVDLRPLHARLASRGVRVAYPAIEDEPSLVFRFVSETAELEERGRGFREPPRTAERAQSLDVIVVPALAADARGHRVGYGAGWYDRTLPAFVPPAHAVVAIFDWQLVAETPDEPGDFPCDWIVTDTRTVRAARDA